VDQHINVIGDMMNYNKLPLFGISLSFIEWATIKAQTAIKFIIFLPYGMKFLIQ